MNTKTTGNTIVESIVIIIASIVLSCSVCCIFVSVNDPIVIDDSYDMTEDDYKRISDVENDIIEKVGVKKVYEYQKLVIKQYRYEKYKFSENVKAP